VIRVPLCARVSRVCPVCVPALPPCLFTGTGTGTVCVPAHPGVFLPVKRPGGSKTGKKTPGGAGTVCVPAVSG
jgi:hypothetical protein